MSYVNLPAFTGKSEEDLRKYIIRLSSELRYALENIDENNLSDDIKSALSEVESVRKNSENILSLINMSGGRTSGRGGFLNIGPMALMFGKEPIHFSSSPVGIGSAPTPVTIRSGPGTNYSGIGTVPAYTPFAVIWTTGGWAYVNYDGVPGYISVGSVNITEIEADDDTLFYSVTYPSAVSDPSVCLTLCGEGTDKYTYAVKEKSDTGFTFTVRKNGGSDSGELNWIALGMRK